MASCIVIGAGMAGLTAARKLTQNGWDVVVLDKGRGVGGRMATRRLENARADHGAQYFSARTPDFQQQVAQLKDAGVVRDWQLQEADLNEGGSLAHPRFVGSDGMSAVAKYLAQDLVVKTAERAVKITQTASGWAVETESQHEYTADALIITAPAPQALALMAESGIELSVSELDAFDAILYQPCIAVVLLLNQPSNIPAPGNMRFEQGGVAWVADNQQKGISPLQPSVTIHAGVDFSNQNFDGDLNGIGTQLIAQLAEWITPDSVQSFQVHRWRYSLAEKRHPEPFLIAQTPSKLLFGGDGFGMGNVEGAYQSGLQMAQYLINAQ